MGYRNWFYSSAFILVFVTFPQFLLTALTFYSLYRRAIIRHNYRPDQSVVTIFLSPRLSQEILPYRLLGDNGILRG